MDQKKFKAIFMDAAIADFDLSQWDKRLRLVAVATEETDLASNGMPLEEAVRKAWTGERAINDYGFTKSTIEKAVGTPGAYTKLQVRFTK